MSNGIIGSATNPSWSGWDFPGTGYGFSFAATSPAFDVMLTNIHAYFDTIFGNGAIGWLCVWDGPSPHNLLISIQQGIINNGSEKAGGQQWWTQPISPPYRLAANSSILIGGYSNQNLLFSTYDTTPQTGVRSMGTGGPTGGTGWSNTGQGPCGAYLEYSTIISSGQCIMGMQPFGAGGLAPVNTASIITSSLCDMGGGPGGIHGTGIVRAAGVSIMGNDTPNGMVCSAVVRRPKIFVWRGNP